MSEIVIRLREKWWRWADKPGRVVELEAADRIEELEAALAEAQQQLEAVYGLLPGTYYMDPPDGGNVSPQEQLGRMANDARRYRWLRETAHPDDVARIIVETGESQWDAAIDAAMEGER